MENNKANTGSSVLPVKTMSSTGGRCHSHPLPPLHDNGSPLDWETEFLFECPKCPGMRMPLSLLHDHKNWHARVNVLTKLRAMTRELDLPGFGPEVRGCLLKIHYGGQFNDLLEARDVEADLNRLLSMPGRSLTTLSYVDGLKYTVGTRFISRLVQGEFVYFNLNHVDVDTKEEEEEESDDETRQGSKNGENYFTLECKEDGLWFSNQTEGCSSSILISVNGVPLPVNEKKEKNLLDKETFGRKLSFGDIVTVSSTADDKRKESSIFSDFIFMAAGRPTTATPEPGIVDSHDDDIVAGEVDTSPSNPLQNPLILQNVLHFIPTEVSKTLRFVSHLWNAEGLKAIRNQVIVTLLNTDHCDAIDGERQISDYASSRMNEFKFPHWKVTIPFVMVARNRRGMDYAHRRSEQEKKILDDLSWLLDPELHFHNVRSLQLFVVVDSLTRVQMTKVLLCGVKDTLTSLDLTIDFGAADQSLPIWVDEVPLLKYLTLSLDLDDRSETFWTPFLESFLPKVGNIEVLTLNGGGGVISFIARIQGEEEGKFQNLRSLTLAETDVSGLAGLGNLRRGTLKKLHLGNVRVPLSNQRQLDQDRSTLCRILERHAESLEELTVHLCIMSLVEGLNITFPYEMPKLKSLSFFISFQPQPGTMVSQVRFIFDPNIRRSAVDYPVHFPSLQKLTVWPIKGTASGHGKQTVIRDGGSSWRKVIPILQVCLKTGRDENGQIKPAPTLQVVDIPLQLEGRYHRVLDNLEDKFPNAVFPQNLDLLPPVRLNEV